MSRHTALLVPYAHWAAERKNDTTIIMLFKKARNHEEDHTHIRIQLSKKTRTSAQEGDHGGGRATERADPWACAVGEYAGTGAWVQTKRRL